MVRTRKYTKFTNKLLINKIVKIQTATGNCPFCPCVHLQLDSEDHREAITIRDTTYWTTSKCSGGCPLYYYARNQSNMRK